MDSFEQCLDAVKEYCKNNESESIYNIWLKGIEPVSYENGTANISVSTDFIKKMIEERYIPLLKRAFIEALGFDIEISISTRNDSENSVSKVTFPEKSTQSDGMYTFENYIVGPDNRFAQAAALAVAQKPGDAYNPLYIYGAPGLGKTHLLMAIKNYLAQTRPDLKVLYLGTEQFTNELILAIKDGNTAPFHDKYRTVDVLLIDDIQFIGGKESTETEFFHTFNTLHNDHKQIVITSDRKPSEIKSLEERIRTRLEWGILADVQPPDIETRISILYSKSEELGLNLHPDVADFIANHVKNDVRQLEGVVKKLDAYSRLEGIAPNITTAQMSIKDVSNGEVPMPVTIEKVINEVARTFNVSPDDIRSPKQNSNVSAPRQIAMYVLREVTQATMQEIGEEFGGRTHSTVVYGLNKIVSQMEKDTAMKNIVSDIIKNIKA